MTTFTKTIKIAIDFNSKESKIETKNFYKELRDLRYKSYLAYNKAITYMYAKDTQSDIQKDLGINIESEKELFGKSMSAWLEDRMKEIMCNSNTGNVAQARMFVMNRYKNDKKAGLLKGNVSLSNFKLNSPIMIHNKNYEILETPKGLGIVISLFNIQKQKELDVKRMYFNFPRINTSQKAILRRIFDKSYKQGVAQITYNERKNKWMLAMSYTFTQDETINDKVNIMGVDLGISKVAFVNVYNNEKEDYELMYFKDKYIDGAELIHFRQKIEARRRQYTIASKHASENATGHGYKRRMKKYLELGDKIKRFRDTANHKYSKWIVDMALKYNCGCIQMEDLSGFSDAQDESLLRNWSYYDLQNKVKYKAAEVGIEVVLIDPAYTSKRCNKCGCIDDANRDCKNAQDKFDCVVCNHKDNADNNASRNIALPNIEKLIKEELKNKDKKAKAIKKKMDKLSKLDISIDTI